MIKSIGQAISSPIELAKSREGSKARAASTAGSSLSEASSGASATPAARMAAEGAPVDMDRVAAIKSAIASGNYPVNAEKIAERMIALDLPDESGEPH
ncbi:flagellar biosynthesis anti-sigma factor FlgM [Sphingobium subterraneum]|uniref:Negative regulator of flagellin synthesis n=1 Tax=Sphingobium subterraneum TaxID=627688 RepID=A0A841IZG4_9SPHN|nr:flagellar biosynthesis anti-sigma factor FlgM [Sphingobium subterraneum]MBB6123804.1 negative regulator of flagellin synthesis FlgM [Sphingobium subterraneum]